MGKLFSNIAIYGKKIEISLKSNNDTNSKPNLNYLDNIRSNQGVHIWIK